MALKVEVRNGYFHLEEYLMTLRENRGDLGATLEIGDSDLNCTMNYILVFQDRQREGLISQKMEVEEI